MQLWLLLLADDAVLFSESREGLQNNINNLESYCKKEWNLKANEEKTKTVFLRLGHRDCVFFADQEIKIVNTFSYLGVVFSSGGSFMQITKTLSGKALRAMH